MQLDETVDVLVVGAGQAGLIASVSAAAAGARTLLIDLRDAVGGTAAKSSGAMWVPGNRFMRERGISDDRASALRYMARLNHPAEYSAAHATLGLPEWEFAGISTFFDNAARALDALLDLGALDVEPNFEFVDYYSHLAENSAPVGRTVFPRSGHGEITGGLAATKRLTAAAERLGVRVELGHTVRELISHDLRVTGAVVADATGAGTAVRVRGGVVFATGGFSKNPALLRRHTHLPYGPGCAVSTNTGEFLTIAASVDAQQAGMDLAWGAPIVIERAIREPDSVCASFYFPGDGFIFVDQRGQRVVNEKAPYNELVRASFAFDTHTATYPALPLIAIWDEEQQHLQAADRLGNPFLGSHAAPYWIVSGSDLTDLSVNIRRRLTELHDHLPSAGLADDFARSLEETLLRFNSLAVTGTDVDFHRGSTPYEIAMAKRMGAGTGPNPTMRPLSTVGPFYATLLAPAAFDTKGGPLTDTHARVVDRAGRPIEGLYAAGNCAASPTGQSYWSGGTSLALAMSGGFVAGEDAARRAQAR